MAWNSSHSVRKSHRSGCHHREETWLIKASSDDSRVKINFGFLMSNRRASVCTRMHTIHGRMTLCRQMLMPVVLSNPPVRVLPQEHLDFGKFTHDGASETQTVVLKVSMPTDKYL